MLGWIIALLGLNRSGKRGLDHRCVCCGREGPTCCLPFLGSRRFCATCANYMLR